MRYAKQAAAFRHFVVDEGVAMNTTQKRAQSDAEFVGWLAVVIALFNAESPFSDFAEACDLYSFDAAERNGFTPQEAFDDFQEWINR